MPSTRQGRAHHAQSWVQAVNVGKAITLGMQGQKHKDENKFVYWNLAYWQERMVRVLIKLDRQERERQEWLERQ